jgi:RNAse (barnase) inhibitor barstar
MAKSLKKSLKKDPKKTIRKPKEVKRDPKRTLRAVPLGSGRPSIPKMEDELDEMWDVLLGRKEPPAHFGTLSLMEVADAYYSRASELTAILQRAERDGFVTKGDALYHFRTGELRTFREMAAKAADLGSRRLTEDQLLFEMERYGRESRGRT